MKKKPSRLEFHLKYCRDQNGKLPTFREVDKQFFDMVDKAHKEGKQLIISKGRTKDIDGYIHNLRHSIDKLIKGEGVMIITPSPEKYVQDVKTYCQLDIVFKQATVKGIASKGCYHLSLKYKEVNESSIPSFYKLK